jgi:hypothetical protein
MRLPSERRLAQARIAVAAIGLVLTLVAIPPVLSIGTGGPLDPVGSVSRNLTRGLEEMSSALDGLGRSLASATTTLDGAQGSVTNAADVSASLAQAMDDLAAASGAQVLGVQPFAALAPRFSELATRSQALAASLRTTGTSLDASRGELDQLRTRVSELQTTLDELRGEGSGVFEGASLGAGRVLLALLLAWLAATAALALIGSLRQLRGADSG